LRVNEINWTSVQKIEQDDNNDKNIRSSFKSFVAKTEDEEQIEKSFSII